MMSDGLLASEFVKQVLCVRPAEQTWRVFDSAVNTVGLSPAAQIAQQAGRPRHVPARGLLLADHPSRRLYVPAVGRHLAVSLQCVVPAWTPRRYRC